MQFPESAILDMTCDRVSVILADHFRDAYRVYIYAVKVRRHTPWSCGPLSWIPGMLVHALSISLLISFATASHNSEIYNIGAHSQ